MYVNLELLKSQFGEIELTPTMTSLTTLKNRYDREPIACIKTHLPWELLPQKPQQENCKTKVPRLFSFSSTNKACYSI